MHQFILIAATALLPADNAEALLEDANIALDRGDLDGAQEAVDEAVTADEENMEALIAGSLIALEREDYDRAILLLQTILTLDPFNDDARSDLVNAYWHNNNIPEAKAILADLLGRHPDLPDALETQKALAAGKKAPERPSPWQLQLKADVAAGYDTNVSMTSQGITTTTGQAAAIGHTTVAAGVAYATRARPFAAILTADIQSTLNGSRTLNEMVPSTLSLNLTGRTHLGPIDGGVQLYHEQVFTDLFQSHYHALGSLNVFGDLGTGETNKIRFMLGTQFRKPTASSGDMTYSASIRDSWTPGAFLMAFDLRGRFNHAIGSSSDTSTSWDTDFIEASATWYTSFGFLTHLSAFFLVDGAWRKFEAGSEYTIFGETGLILSIDPIEIHTEYTLTRNDSLNSELDRDFIRHQVSLGVRYWYN